MKEWSWCGCTLSESDTCRCSYWWTRVPGNVGQVWHCQRPSCELVVNSVRHWLSVEPFHSCSPMTFLVLIYMNSLHPTYYTRSSKGFLRITWSSGSRTTWKLYIPPFGLMQSWMTLIGGMPPLQFQFGLSDVWYSRIATIAPFAGLHCFPEGRHFKQWTRNDSKALMKVCLHFIDVMAHGWCDYIGLPTCHWGTCSNWNHMDISCLAGVHIPVPL